MPRPPTTNIVNYIWLFEKKHNTDGSLAQYTTRLVANGHSQQPDIDCYETFNPIVKSTTIQAALSLDISLHWLVH